MTRSDPLPKTYATLSFAGDRLDPADISAIIPVSPKRAHRKGASFEAGQRAGRLKGRTGIWYFDTRDVPSPDLRVHLRQLLLLIGDTDRVNRLRAVMKREGAAAHVSCFWFGEAGMKPPTIPDDVRTELARLHVDIETDFQTA